MKTFCMCNRENSTLSQWRIYQIRKKLAAKTESKKTKLSDIVPSALQKRTELPAQSSHRRNFGFVETPRLPCVMYVIWDVNMTSFALFVLTGVGVLFSVSWPFTSDASRTRGQVAALFRQLPNAIYSYCNCRY